MSFFGSSTNNTTLLQQQANFEAASTELEMVSDLFNRLTRSCHTKCIGNRYLEPDLNKGESICIDRCVDKFFKVNAKVGERMQVKGSNASLKP
ncbi:mitochondrial protein-transporting ATPase [Phakopsora pachyrhizi]|uniref:Mitochondrial import inner membrane translocase subunit n=1 Tax=Phakopsora pachyrhizi TaxID=170000 RepID=A0AAV0ANY9_PHAPC|nr:mitochondrial protein-transporting ATPase [Phakopsora pachyrhizi]CAH7670668.1 mitochondrial protein-transporting ATPase [Phakopsora pachyrhizi]